MPVGRGLTSVKQVDMRHTGQPTLLCHQILRFRAFKRVAVDGVLTWPLSTCMPAKVRQRARRCHCNQAATWEVAEESDLTLTAFGPQGSYFTRVTWICALAMAHFCEMVPKIAFSLQVSAFIFNIVSVVTHLNWSPCAELHLSARFQAKVNTSSTSASQATWDHLNNSIYVFLINRCQDYVQEGGATFKHCTQGGGGGWWACRMQDSNTRA